MGVTPVPQLSFMFYCLFPKLSLCCLGVLWWPQIRQRAQDQDVINEFNLNFNETTS